MTSLDRFKSAVKKVTQVSSFTRAVAEEAQASHAPPVRHFSVKLRILYRLHNFRDFS